MKKVNESNSLVMVRFVEDVTAKANIMPKHIKGKKKDGTTSNYFKQPEGTLFAEWDYYSVQMHGLPYLPKSVWLAMAEGLFRKCSKFGKKGGTRADVNAQRVLSSLIKEGLVEVITKDNFTIADIRGE